MGLQRISMLAAPQAMKNRLCLNSEAKEDLGKDTGYQELQLSKGFIWCVVVGGRLSGCLQYLNSSPLFLGQGHCASLSGFQRLHIPTLNKSCKISGKGNILMIRFLISIPFCFSNHCCKEK